MKKTVILLLFVLILTGCSNSKENKTDIINSEVQVQKEETTDSKEYNDYTGTWIRNELYVNNQLEQAMYSVLILQNDSFSKSSGTCQNYGSVLLENNTITLSTTNAGCPGLNPDMTYSYNLEDNNEKDGKILTLETIYGGVKIKEVYLSKKSTENL
jgi:hypothetical protein